MRIPTYDGNRPILSLEVVHAYFAELNSISVHITRDINDTRLSYGQLWYTLNASEQNDIINETLIKPELALKYFDNCSTTNSAKTVSPAATAPLPAGNSPVLFAVRSKSSFRDHILSKSTLPTETADKEDELTFDINTPEVAISPAKRTTTSGNNVHRHCYEFNSRNLSSYSLQTVSLKLVHDELLGSYRDEHSQPFSYRTKSQINLHLFCNAAGDHIPITTADDNYKLGNSASIGKMTKSFETCAYNYEQQQAFCCGGNNSFVESTPSTSIVSVSKSNCCTRQKECKFSLFKTKFMNKNRFKNSTISTPTKIAKNNYMILNNLNGNKMGLRMTTDQPVKIGKGTVPTTANENCRNPTLTCNFYTDAFCCGNCNETEKERCSYIVQHSGGVIDGVETASSSTSSENDEEKTSCEDAKLLDNDICNLRKNFDFLNNW